MRYFNLAEVMWLVKIKGGSKPGVAHPRVCLLGESHEILHPQGVQIFSLKDTGRRKEQQRNWK